MPRDTNHSLCAADPSCTDCKGTGWHWHHHGEVRFRCECVKEHCAASLDQASMTGTAIARSSSGVRAALAAAMRVFSAEPARSSARW
jgi:hypothetical protein